MAKMNKKKFNIKGVFDGIRFSVGAQQKSENEIEETLRTDHFQVCNTVRHGFPYQPTAVAFDPVQHLLAIGTKTGWLRLLGRPGVDISCCHDNEVAVTQIVFLGNEGALVTVCSDDSLHLWNFRQKHPEIVHSLKFQRERITFCHLAFQSKWLYIGTERGNVHIVNIESFVLSGYVINWNKAIELSRKTHPGVVVHLSDNPVDPNKLLIGFESGTIVLWDLKSKQAEFRYNSPEALRSVSWHHEGKQFMCSHSDGSLTRYNVRQPPKYIDLMMPHAKTGRDGKAEPCKPIAKVEWKSVKNSFNFFEREPLVIFSGGMSYDRAGRTPTITVMNGKSTTVLEMEHNIVDFVVLCETPWVNDFQEPYAIVVLLQNDLVVVDLTTPGYPCFENPYPMDIHESPVTALQYYADCPPDIIPAFYSVGSKQKRSGFSEKEWPIKGGVWGTTTCSYPEILITGHADGSVKFWDASSVTLQVLYKLKTAKIFEKPKKESQDDDPFAVYLIHLCPESRILCLAGATHLILFKFSKQEVSTEVSSLDISIVYEVYDDLDSPDFECPKSSTPSLSVVSQQQSGSMGSYSSNTSDSHSCKLETGTALIVKSGSRKFSAGYYSDLVCLLQYLDSEHPGNITYISVNSVYGLLAFGNESGLAIIDYLQKTCLLNLGTPDLYGSMDPYQRAPRSPRGKKFNQAEFSGNEEGCRSPTTDQSPSPETNPARLKKKSSWPSDYPLLAIKESQQTDSDKSDQEVNSSVDDENVETADLAETLDNDTNTLNDKKESDEGGEISMESSMRKNIRRMSVQPLTLPSLKVQLAETSYSDEERTPTNNNNEHNLTFEKLPIMGKKKKVGKTKSEPSGLIGKYSNGKGDDRPRSSSEPDIDMEPPEKQKTRRISLHKLGFHRKKSHAKKCKEDVGVSCDSDNLNNSKSSHGDDDFHNKHHKEITDDETDEEKQDTGFFKSMRRMSVQIQNKLFKEDDKKPRLEVLDLSNDKEGHTTIRKMSITELLQPAIVYLKPDCDKNDGASFSRSRSSSMSSLENVSKEAIQSLIFADSYTRKTDNFTCPCLWVGTSLGSVLVIVLNLPPPGDQRLSQPVIVSPSGTIFRLKGAILTMSFLDCNGVLIPSIHKAWRETEQKETPTKEPKTPRQLSMAQKPRISPTSSTEVSDKQYAVLCSEKQARVVSLPSQSCPYKTRITDSSFVVRADIVSMRDSVCLACYIANGRIMTFSLPSLKPLLDIDFLALTDLRIARTFSFSSNGHASYLCSPTEIQKISFSADLSDNLNEMLGDLFVATCETPEAPKQGFFKNLFGGGNSILDREDLFGESSGKGSRGLATKIPGRTNMQYLQAGTVGVTGEVAKTRQLFLERGEKLGELGERTEQMLQNAESFSSASHAIMLKYKDKKWYQF
ncbi:syntaxin-binding protein 5-like isoform X1 [Mytilus californianus]|uniref:syntaxin-binding protein 5-like isoform X1 n=1 Tax=Mytilus californianus TaxID=6549 RepID=UPI002247E861|nr:syntaxin-binding protein 5-like isoform X1 [Mytilus californianus]